MDVGRRPYRTACRPFRDTDTEVTVHWYSVPKENGTLGIPCRINSLCWRDAQINPSPVGEVSAEPQLFDGWGSIPPPVGRHHYHGTPEDFRLGGLENTDAPPLPRGVSGLPLECSPPPGGVVLGGAAVVVYPQPLSAGGVVIGGYAVPPGTDSVEQVLVHDGDGVILCHTNVPVESAFLWVGVGQGYTWDLTNTAPRGDFGDWRLELEDGSAVWETSEWDGIATRLFTLVSGTWVGDVFVQFGG